MNLDWNFAALNPRRLSMDVIDREGKL